MRLRITEQKVKQSKSLSTRIKDYLRIIGNWIMLKETHLHRVWNMIIGHSDSKLSSRLEAEEIKGFTKRF